jgi:hypothetical protein
MDQLVDHMNKLESPRHRRRSSNVIAELSASFGRGEIVRVPSTDGNCRLATSSKNITFSTIFNLRTTFK